MKYLVLGFMLLTGSAFAAGEATYNKGFSTWTVTGVICTSGTAVNISTGIPGFNISGIRLINQGSQTVWLGPNNLVSTDTALGSTTALGESLTAGANGVWELGKNTTANLGLPIVQLWCKAADAAGATPVKLSRALFGYP